MAYVVTRGVVTVGIARAGFHFPFKCLESFYDIPIGKTFTQRAMQSVAIDQCLSLTLDNAINTILFHRDLVARLEFFRIDP